MVGLCRNYFDRFRNDNIDINAFSQAGAGEAALVRIFDQYTNALQVIGPEVMDFAGLEFQFLQWLEAGNLDGFKDGLSALLVDEFQDTNVLQESIYYELARAIGGAITIVGDDDQALYRFRGATVELFRNAQARIQTALEIPTPPTIRYLMTNYRCPGLLVQFNQDFADLDPDYQPSRVARTSVAFRGCCAAYSLSPSMGATTIQFSPSTSMTLRTRLRLTGGCLDAS